MKKKRVTIYMNYIDMLNLKKQALAENRTISNYISCFISRTLKENLFKNKKG